MVRLYFRRLAPLLCRWFDPAGLAFVWRRCWPLSSLDLENEPQHVPHGLEVRRPSSSKHVADLDESAVTTVAHLLPKVEETDELPRWLRERTASR